mgnify:FL=1
MKIFNFLLLFVIVGCTTHVQKKDLAHLQGYWIVKEALAPNGEKRPFVGADVVDFFELNENKGFRKKLKPLLGNQFNSSNDNIGFTVSLTDESCMITYTRQQLNWQEEIIALDAHELKLKDARGVVFIYNRYTP